MNEILDRIRDAYHRDRVDEVDFHAQLAVEFANLLASFYKGVAGRMKVRRCYPGTRQEQDNRN